MVEFDRSGATENSAGYGDVETTNPVVLGLKITDCSRHAFCNRWVGLHLTDMKNAEA